jgi:hypothetical protein
VFATFKAGDYYVWFSFLLGSYATVLAWYEAFAVFADLV